MNVGYLVTPSLLYPDILPVLSQWCSDGVGVLNLHQRVSKPVEAAQFRIIRINT